MTRPSHDHEAPPRLLDQGGETARVLREAQHQYRDQLDEPAAWLALQARRANRPVRRWLVPLTAGLVVTVAAILLLLPLVRDDRGRAGGGFAARLKTPTVVPPGRQVPGTARDPERPNWSTDDGASAPARDQVALDRGASARTGRLQPSTARRRLPPGRTLLADGSEVRLPADSTAEVHGVPGKNTTIELQSGSVELRVAPQHERSFEVNAGRWVFRVIGTRFRVSMPGRQRPELEVVEGTVAVLDGGAVVARIGAGGRWQAIPEAVAEAPAERPAPPPDATGCLALARHGRAPEAIECLQPIAGGSGLSAEMALYEIARLQRDVMAEPRAALTTLHQHTTRFPQGALQAEVRLSRIDLLSRLGRTEEALAESWQLLRAPAGQERAADLHLLRGNLLRERVRDCASAVEEYRRAEVDSGATGAEAMLGRARCLEAMGRRAEAVAAYRTLVERAQGRTAAEARRRLQEMRP